MNTTTTRRRLFTILIAAALALATGGLLFAGPLNPPAGPVTSTNKTLQEVEPRIAINLTNTPGDANSLFKITQPGSYYLTGNITGVVGKHGIEIASSRVTIDLGGFEVRGVAGTLNGVMVDGTLTGVAVTDGSVTGWAGYGVRLIADISGNGEQHRVERVNVVANGDVGIAVGYGSIVRHCLVRDNMGSEAIRARGTAIVEYCMVIDNTGNGIDVGDASTVTGCSVQGSSGVGISVDKGSVVTSCASRKNGLGIYASTGSTIMDCSASENTGGGIRVDTACLVARSTATANGGTGFGIGNTTTIVDCVSLNNVGNGIFATFRCVIRNNQCDGNGAGTGDGAGIVVVSVDNRIEGNACRLNDRGIEVDGTGNFIAGNTCSGNGNNWDVVAGNVCFVVSATTSAAITGNSGGVSPGSTSAWANFTY